MLFIETDSPPPFYQERLTSARRKQLDQWFIGHRTQCYYLKRFEQFDKQGYLSPKWHWAAFFITFPWLLYRKRYMDALVYSVAGWSFIQLNVVITLVFRVHRNVLHSGCLSDGHANGYCGGDLAVLVVHGGALDRCLLLPYGAA